ncbi:helix-turn-helix domain-containing protein [Salmonella enterica]|nr:helix-turn-helix domain-containing protein [Salmonella enterica]
MHENFSDFSLVGEGKENFKARLQKLIGTRSVRAAASDWGVPVSTLNNYLHKGTEPSFKVVCLISNKEHVSLNWLAYGQDEATKSSLQPMETAGNDHNDLANELLRRAQSADKEKLINAICDIGIKGILNKLQQSDEGVTGQAEREYTMEEQEAMLRALPISERAKNTAILALALGDDAQKEIFEILEDFKRRIAPEGNADNTAVTPDPSLKQKAG